MNEKLRNKIILYRFDEHNLAFHYWKKAFIEENIQSPLDLFHVDAHADMGRPSTFRESLYVPLEHDPLKYHKRFASKELNIQNFIYPAVLGGLVRNVYFFFPRWRNFKPMRSRIQIGSAFGEGKIIKYPPRLARGAHQATITRAIPDLTRFSFVSGLIERMPHRRKVILDIDLDYFACQDSIQNKWEYKLEITPSQYRDRGFFLRDETIGFSGLRFAFKKLKRRHVAIVSMRKVPEKAHMPSHQEIRESVDLLVSTLRRRSILPVVITLCRSRISGYCPKKYGKFIENLLLKKLSEIYSLEIDGSISPPKSKTGKTS